MSLCLVATLGLAARADDSTQQAYRNEIAPLFATFCNECHAGDQAEAEIDFEGFETLSDLRRKPKVWLKTRAMLDTGQMPPEDAKQPSQAQHQQLRDWVRDYLKVEAAARAGDPGRVVLRRLSNAEYGYTVRDLTGLDALDPTSQFPIDGASGEGFTNVGDGLVMSPSLVTKYLDAAKEVADHIVLLPDGIAFSEHVSQRDWTEQWLTRIQSFYRRAITPDHGDAEVRSDIQMDANDFQRLAVDKYVAATLQERESLSRGNKAIAAVADRRGLNAKYLETLWNTLSVDTTADSNFLIADLQQRWRRSGIGAEDVAGLTATIKSWQDSFWKFNSIGHIGREGGPKAWMEPVKPLVSEQNLRLPLPQATDQNEVTFYLSVVGAAADGTASDHVIWKNMRLEGAGRPPLLLRDATSVAKKIGELRRTMLSRTADYLAAASDCIEDDDVSSVAQTHELDSDLLMVWLRFLSIGNQVVPVHGHYTQTERNPGGVDFITGWGTSTPSFLANSSDQELRIPGIARPHSVVCHPSPTLYTAVGWRSPFSGLLKVSAEIADAHPECGNGVEYFVQHRTVSEVQTLGQGDFAVQGEGTVPERTLMIGKGDLIALLVGPKEGQHSCDLTRVDLTISEVGGEGRVWDLADDVSDDILAGNPHADRHGNADTWHFFRGEMSSLDRHVAKANPVPPGSILADWQQERDITKQAALAGQLQELVTGNPPPTDSVNAPLYDQILSLRLPLDHPSLSQNVRRDERFGVHPNGRPIDSTDFVVRAPAIIEFRLPAEVALGRDVVADVAFESVHELACAQVQLVDRKPERLDLSPATPFLVSRGVENASVTAAIDEFRNLFPPALCYANIVPLDEVVTFALFYRQDESLQRLMLDESQIAELDRLWDQLLYLSHEPLQLVVAHEQIYEFATQDNPALVKALAPIRAPLRKRADDFRQRLLDTEPAHIHALLRYIEQAWRRPLDSAERSKIHSLYRSLREAELSHDDSIRLTFARALTSPAFLYRREVAREGSAAHRVTDFELASRLSYFLRSSLPDAELTRIAAEGRLHDDGELWKQAERLLQSGATRRLAEHFACQWLHLRDFDQNDEKNEKLYPEFTEIRGDMYEETVQFFADMFATNGSVLGIIDADHTFLNEPLAKHYGIEDVRGPQWRRVDGVRKRGRGGVITMATVLASQSGASRTSPILRGNWIYETLLGERLPRPPANVPQLPDKAPQSLTARQLIERHSSDPACAKCHVKIDPFGFSLEQYDAIGRLRPNKVDTQTRLPDGHEIEGIEGLRDYLSRHRQGDVLRQFCRKLLGYALGREVQLSDEPLLETMQQGLKTEAYRFNHAVRVIVTSKQFREIRGRDFVEP